VSRTTDPAALGGVEEVVPAASGAPPASEERGELLIGARGQRLGERRAWVLMVRRLAAASGAPRGAAFRTKVMMSSTMIMPKAIGDPRTEDAHHGPGACVKSACFMPTAVAMMIATKQITDSAASVSAPNVRNRSIPRIVRLGAGGRGSSVPAYRSATGRLVG
jgi:hypothetical protein